MPLADRMFGVTRSTRRRFLHATFGSAGALLFATACAQAPPSPTAAPPVAAPTAPPPPPTPIPTNVPTTAPTVVPTAAPTVAPTQPPAATPTVAATTAPAVSPTTAPIVDTLAWPAAWSRQVTAPIQLLTAHTWDPAQQKVQQQFDDGFVQRHPNFKISPTYSTWDDFLAKWLPQAAAGTLPDVLYSDDTWIQQLIQKKLAVDLSPLISSDPGFEFDHIVKNSLGPSMYQGKGPFAIPYGWVCRALGYRKDLFDKAGVGYPDDTWTYDTLRQTAQKLTVTGQQWGFYISGFSSWPTQGDFLAPFGGAIVSDDETKSLITTPKSIAALQWWADFVLKDKTALGEWQVGSGASSGVQGDPLALGKAAMGAYATWYTAGWLKEDANLLQHIDVALYPKGPDARTAAACDSRFFISSQSKNVDASWTYLREYMSARGLADAFVIPGYDWSSRPESEAYYLKGPNLPTNAQKWLDMSNNYAVTCFPISAPSSEIMRVVKQHLADLWSGKSDAATVAKAIDTEIQPLVAKNRG